jgi:B-box zinc finger
MSNPLPSLAAQRCRNHPQREAAASCTTCRRLFCRECVADHHGRMVCAECLARAIAAATPRGRARGNLGARLRRAAAVTTALLAAWLYFYIVGQLLHSVPATMEEFAAESAEP